MIDSNTLEMFAELSIGLIGFAGVVSALGRSRLHIDVRSFRVRALLFYSATALISSLIPIVAGGFGFEGQTVVFFSTLIMGAAFLAILLWFGRTARPLTENGHLPIALARGLGTLGLMIIVMLAYGLVFARSYLDSLYLVGLTWILMMGVFHFCMLVLSIQLDDRST